MQNVVVDTNILVRAFLKPDSSDGKILQRVFNQNLDLWYSEELLDELIRVLAYPRLAKYQITKERVDIYLAQLFKFGKFILSHKTKLCRDPDDNEILGIALAVIEESPVYLISADKDLLVLKAKVHGVNIVTPQEFLQEKPQS